MKRQSLHPPIMKRIPKGTWVEKHVAQTLLSLVRNDFVSLPENKPITPLPTNRWGCEQLHLLPDRRTIDFLFSPDSLWTVELS